VTSWISHNLLPSHLCVFISRIKSEWKYSHNYKFLCIKRLVGYPRYWVLCQRTEAQQSGSSPSTQRTALYRLSLYPSNKGLWFGRIVWSPFVNRTHCNVKIAMWKSGCNLATWFWGHDISLLSKGTRRNFSGRSCMTFKHLYEKQLSDEPVLPAAPCWGGPEPTCLGINGKESLGQCTASRFQPKHIQTLLWY